jgi:hypothetical protein
MVRSTLFLITTACCLGACQPDEKTFDRHLVAPVGGRLAVDLDIGSASIVGNNSHEVTVHARMRGFDDVLSQLTISTEQDPSGLRVIEHASALRRWFAPTAARVQFTIEVPRDYPVLVKSSGGSLELQNLHASVKVTAVGGSITVRDVLGSVDAQVYGGSITVERLNGRATLVASGGAIRIADATGDLDLHTVGGGVWLEKVDGQVSAQTTGGSISAAVLGDHDISLLTYGGSIKLSVPATIRASLDALTLGGSVHSNIALSSSVRAGLSSLSGTINGGGHSIRLQTTGGSIELEPLFHPAVTESTLQHAVLSEPPGEPPPLSQTPAALETWIDQPSGDLPNLSL